ncbi:ROK family protein [Oceanicella sp. SM1341]|uniref:ROK family protein n=1 Tax=Oceanicella sp. SM1341 TaxID=1548889 RepID=UPI000E50C32D|nr:ROK family protein [Oceanicella sp. SM1341]
MDQPLSPAGGLTPRQRRRLATALRHGTTEPDAGLAERGWLTPAGALRADAGCLFGCDVGGTKIQSVVIALDGTILAEQRDPTPAGGGEAALACVEAHFRTLGAGRAIRAAGIGLPGALRPDTGHLERAPNLGGLAGRDMRRLFAGRLGLPVAVENDVSLAALGESWRGHGNCPLPPGGPLAFVALGTGIGMGLAQEGRLMRGARGTAGEIAFLPLGGDPFGPAAKECGALESVVSGRALAEEYRRRGGRRPGSLRELFRAPEGDAELAAVMDRLAERVALAVLSIDAVINPALFVFGGGIGSRPELLTRVRERLELCCPEPPPCRISALGNRAGGIGAARAGALALADALEEAA